MVRGGAYVPFSDWSQVGSEGTERTKDGISYQSSSGGNDLYRIIVLLPELPLERAIWLLANLA